MNIKKMFTTLSAMVVAVTMTMPSVSVLAATPDTELGAAYEWAYSKGVTTMDSYEKANMWANITRAEMAKMLSVYATEVLGYEADTSKACTFTDIDSVKGDLHDYIIESCQLGLMGQGITAFRPYDTISRAEFGTALSRTLWGDTYEGGTPYYAKHLQALQSAGIMKQIANAESTKEVRGYVMIMLQRSEENASPVDCSDTDVVLVCMEDLDKCPAACKAEYEEDNGEHEVVKSGDLAVTAAANNGSIIVGTPSDLDTITFKTSEEVEITKVILKRYGFSASADIANVWLENDDGLVISNKKPVNSKGLTTLTIDKDYRTVDGTLNATIVVQTVAGLNKQGATIGFKVDEVESTAANVDLPSKDPTTYSVIKYDGSKVVASTRGGIKTYNYAEGEMYEVAKFKVKAADDSAILINGFTLVDVAGAPNVARIGDVIDDVTVTIDDVEVKGLKFSTDKRKLTVSFDEVEVAAKQNANIVLSISLTDFDNNFGSNIDFTLTDTDFNAVEATTKVRVSLTDANYVALGTMNLQTNLFKGGKVKYTSTKLGKVEAAAGSKDVVIAEGSIEIPEAINATFSIAANHAVIEEMRMYVAGEEFDGTWNAWTNRFDFDVELTKWGKVQFKVDIDDNATKWTKVQLWTLALSAMGLTYDSNNQLVTVKWDAAGSISFSDLTVTEAKASLENSADDTVEFIVKETNRKVVFDGTYTAKKADIYLDSFKIDGNAFTHGSVTFYLYLDGEEVADTDNIGTAEDFSKVLVEGWKSISVKVEAEVDAGNTPTTNNYVYTLSLNGIDVDDLPVATATEDLAEMAVVEKGSVTVTTASGKTTVLLKKANTTIAEFTVKPDKWDDTYLESLAFVADVNAYDIYLTADDVNVKIDGVAEEGETVYAAATWYKAGMNITLGQLVEYNWKYYQAAWAINPTTDWATDYSATGLVAVPTYTAGSGYNTNDYVIYNWAIYKATANIAAATDWATDFNPTTGFVSLANHIVFDLTQELGSDGVTVEVILKKKTAGTVRVSVDDVNGAITAKTFTKRFEDALVWVADQIDNEWSTTFVLWVSKSESSIEINNVCLYYINGATSVASKCVNTAVSDGNDDLEWTNPDVDGKQVMIDAITYNIKNTTACAAPTVAWSKITAPSATDGCVTITKEDYNDYFKVGSTYAKIFATK